MNLLLGLVAALPLVIADKTPQESMQTFSGFLVIEFVIQVTTSGRKYSITLFITFALFPVARIYACELCDCFVLYPNRDVKGYLPYKETKVSLAMCARNISVGCIGKICDAKHKKNPLFRWGTR